MGTLVPLRTLRMDVAPPQQMRSATLVFRRFSSMRPVASSKCKGELPRRGELRAVAEDIGVSPEAFYRELQRRRK